MKVCGIRENIDNDYYARMGISYNTKDCKYFDEANTKEKKMKAVYEFTMQVKVIQEVDDITALKSDREFAVSVGEMIADEATQCNGVATFDVLESSLNVK